MHSMAVHVWSKLSQLGRKNGGDFPWRTVVGHKSTLAAFNCILLKSQLLNQLDCQLVSLMLL